MARTSTLTHRARTRCSEADATSRMAAATPTLVVAGTNSGVGKTTVAVGLMQALRQAGLVVQPFKVGPDFLDGLQHARVCGAPSVNLDGWLMGRERCLRAFDDAVAARGADVAVVEGCMGLHDGRDGSSDDGSTAQIAKWLGAPVVLVVDAWSLARSAAAMVHGYATFDSDVDVAAAIFNRVGGDSHGAWLREALSSAPTTRDVAVLACLPSRKTVSVEEKLLGLVPPRGGDAARLEALATLFDDHVDVAAARALAAPVDRDESCAFELVAASGNTAIASPFLAIALALRHNAPLVLGDALFDAPLARDADDLLRDLPVKRSEELVSDGARLSAHFATMFDTATKGAAAKAIFDPPREDE